MSPFGEYLSESGVLPTYFNDTFITRFVLSDEIDMKARWSVPNFTFCNAEDFTYNYAMGCLCTSIFGSIHIDKVSDNFDWLAFSYLVGRWQHTDLKLSTIHEDAKQSLTLQVKSFSEAFFHTEGHRDEELGFKILHILEGMTVTNNSLRGKDAY